MIFGNYLGCYSRLHTVEIGGLESRCVRVDCELGGGNRPGNGIEAGLAVTETVRR